MVGNIIKVINNEEQEGSDGIWKENICGVYKKLIATLHHVRC